MTALYMIGGPISDIRGGDVGLVADDGRCHYVDSEGISNALGGDGRVAMLVEFVLKSVPPTTAREWLAIATYNLTYFGWGTVHEAPDLDEAVKAVQDELQRREAALQLIASVVAAVQDWELTRGRRANRRFLRDLVYEYWERPAFGDNGGFSARLQWSQAARERHADNLATGQRPNKGLQRDHVTPVKVIWQRMIDVQDITPLDVGAILRDSLEVRVITNEEHLGVEAARRENPDLIGWAPYERAGLDSSFFARGSESVVEEKKVPVASPMTVRTLDDAIRFAGVENVAQFERAIAAYPEELEGFVDLTGEPAVLIVGVHDRGTGLEYPFPFEEIWSTLDELEAEVEAKLAEEAAEEAAIYRSILSGLEYVWESDGSKVWNLSRGGFIQAAKWTSGDLQIECVSDAFLADDERLSFVQRRRLANLGFNPPSAASPNYYVCYGDQADLVEAATLLAQVVAEVFEDVII